MAVHVIVSLLAVEILTGMISKVFCNASIICFSPFLLVPLQTLRTSVKVMMLMVLARIKFPAGRTRGTRKGKNHHNLSWETKVIHLDDQSDG